MEVRTEQGAISTLNAADVSVIDDVEIGIGTLDGEDLIPLSDADIVRVNVTAGDHLNLNDVEPTDFEIQLNTSTGDDNFTTTDIADPVGDEAPITVDDGTDDRYYWSFAEAVEQVETDDNNVTFDDGYTVNEWQVQPGNVSQGLSTAELSQGDLNITTDDADNRAQLNFSADGNTVLDLGSNVANVSNIVFNGTDLPKATTGQQERADEAIIGGSSASFDIENNVFDQFDSASIGLGTIGDVTITNNEFINSTGSFAYNAISVNEVNGNSLDIENNDIQDVDGAEAINISANNNAEVNITDNNQITFEGGTPAINLSGNATIEIDEIEITGDDSAEAIGVNTLGSSATIDITQSEISNVGAGTFMQGDVSDVSVDETEFDEMEFGGIFVAAPADVTVNESTFKNDSGETELGIQIGNGGADLTVDENSDPSTFENVTQGIEIRGADGLNISGSEFEDIGTDAINVTAANLDDALVEDVTLDAGSDPVNLTRVNASDAEVNVSDATIESDVGGVIDDIEISGEVTNATIAATAVEPDPAEPDNREGVDRYFNATDTYDDGELENVTLEYDSGELGDIDEDSLSLWNTSGTEWEEVSDSGVDTAASVITANISEFSTFGGFGELEATGGDDDSGSSGGGGSGADDDEEEEDETEEDVADDDADDEPVEDEPADDEVVDDTDDETPGFGVFAGLAALIGLVLFLTRKRP